MDWKTTSRRLSLISRECCEQRNQNIILAIGCGRRLRAMEDGVPQFDHALNALLLLAFVGLRQGDNVGIMGRQKSRAMVIMLTNLRAAGADTLDTSTGELPIALANRYLSLKRSGRL